MGPVPTVTIRRLNPEDWQLFRDIRLRALAEAPTAFSSTLAEASGLDEAAWRARLGGRAQFVALLESDAVGTAAGIMTEGGAELISLWVDPRVRGAGIGDQLVRAVLDWAGAEGRRAVTLWVAAGNRVAERLYARHGFRRTGQEQPMGHGGPTRWEFAMRCALVLAPDGGPKGAGPGGQSAPP